MLDNTQVEMKKSVVKRELKRATNMLNNDQDNMTKHVSRKDIMNNIDTYPFIVIQYSNKSEMYDLKNEDKKR